MWNEKYTFRLLLSDSMAKGNRQLRVLTGLTMLGAVSAFDNPAQNDKSALDGNRETVQKAIACLLDARPGTRIPGVFTENTPKGLLRKVVVDGGENPDYTVYIPLADSKPQTAGLSSDSKLDPVALEIYQQTVGPNGMYTNFAYDRSGEVYSKTSPDPASAREEFAGHMKRILGACVRNQQMGGRSVFPPQA